MDHLCYLCLVFVMFSRLFIAALWSPEDKGLTPCLLLVLLIVILLLSHLVAWDRCGFVCFFTSHQQSFSYVGTGLPGLNQH